MWVLALLIAAPPQAPQLPAWMAGCWSAQVGDRSTVECWTIRSSKAMAGTSISKWGGKVVERETMLIEHAETDDPAVPWMTFRAVPAGQSATEFHWVASEAPGLTFLNAQHDYPQRIRYWREGKFLMAEIAAADGSKARRWRYAPRPRSR
jgi:predicted NAD/FAD-dependent oxidoreductase